MSSFLSNDFKPVSAAEWKQKIQFELKGEDYNKALVTKTNEGIDIKPFYHSDNFEKLKIPVSKEDFKICQKIKIINENDTHKKALEIINKGVNALYFIADKPFNTTSLFDSLLNKNIDFHFEMHFLNEEFINELLKLLEKENVFYNIDIIGNLSATGNWYTSLSKDFEVLGRIIEKNPSKFMVSVNVALYQNAGANMIQQVAYALAHANEYLTRFEGEIANKIQFNFAVGSHYFFEISKLRAFKYLYNLILKPYKTSAVAKLFVTPSLRNKTIYDYNVNLLRTTTECMSAILGGADTIANIDYDALFHHPTDFGERISRNQLIILKEESYFKNAQSIATDSYYIETVTKQMAEKALALFKEIEQSGGFLYQLKEGTIQRKIKESAQKEQADFNSGKLVLLGTNKYPNKDDKMKHNLQLKPFVKYNPKKTLIPPIIPTRLAAALEQKRLDHEA